MSGSAKDCGNCGTCTNPACVERMAAPEPRSSEFDALSSILRALEGLTDAQRVRVLAAAICAFESEPAHAAIAQLVMGAAPAGQCSKRIDGGPCLRSRLALRCVWCERPLSVGVPTAEAHSRCALE